MLSTIQVPLVVTVTVSTHATPDVPNAPGEIKLSQGVASPADKGAEAMGTLVTRPVGKVASKRGRKPRTVDPALYGGPVFGKPAKAKPAKPAKRKARAPKSDNAAKVVDAIARGADKFADLLVSTGIKRATLRAVLGRLKKDGKIFGAGKKFEMVYGRTQAEADKRSEAKKAK